MKKTLVILVLSLALLLPSSALSYSPTDAQYGGELTMLEDGGSESSSISSLPVTGLDLVWIVLIGSALVGTGFLVRRASIKV